MPRSRTAQLCQGGIRLVSRIMAIGVFQIRCNGRQFIPTTGGGLLLSNHQSNLDPYVLGFCSDRLLNYVA
ncbi:MAG TPA: 1-acyl-sn-glycerol-3-phosphate acyltransferase, partial [Pirellulales bacterium]|nr:1-acyl-sn-glycerol-3-phosphate acyltransferase [Pirellulales bacterium]